MHECATRITGKPRRAVGASSQTYMHIIYAHKNTYWKRREDIHPRAAAYMPTTTHKLRASDICGCAHSLFADSCWHTNTYTHTTNAIEVCILIASAEYDKICAFLVLRSSNPCTSTDGSMRDLARALLHIFVFEPRAARNLGTKQTPHPRTHQ